jgi:hypothetical protein
MWGVAATKRGAVGPNEAGRQREVAGEDGARLVEAVAVFVLEQRDAAEVGRAVAFLGVVDHFADEHPAVFVEGEGDGIADLGFVGDKLDLEAGFHFPGGEGVFRRDGGVARELLGGIEGGAGAGGGGGGGGVGVAGGEAVGGGEGGRGEERGQERERGERGKRGRFHRRARTGQAHTMHARAQACRGARAAAVVGGRGPGGTGRAGGAGKKGPNPRLRLALVARRVPVGA